MRAVLLPSAVVHHDYYDCSSPINRLSRYGENLLVSGDDDGGIRVWDARQVRPTGLFRWEEHEDFVADFYPYERKNALVSAGGDGMLGVWDLRKGKLNAMSDNVEDELLSVCRHPFC